MNNQIKVVYPGHGHEKAMGYRYRCRIESRTKRTWFGFGEEIKQYRYVIERHFMAWEDDDWGCWCGLQEAQDQAERRLSEIAWSPTDEPKDKSFYVS
jgi:hypothetical protein